jgi:hypothetical protein
MIWQLSSRHDNEQAAHDDALGCSIIGTLSLELAAVHCDHEVVRSMSLCTLAVFACLKSL